MNANQFMETMWQGYRNQLISNYRFLIFGIQMRKRKYKGQMKSHVGFLTGEQMKVLSSGQ